MLRNLITRLISRILPRDTDRPTDRSAAEGGNYNWIENRMTRRIYSWIEKHPWFSVFLALILPLLWVVVASDFLNNPTLKEQNYELSFSLFIETIILIATVILVKLFLDKRKADERKPVYDALYGSTHRIYENIYDLVHHSLAETSRRRYEDGFICPWIDRNYTKYIKQNGREGRSRDFLSSLIDELNKSVDRIILPKNDIFNAFSEIEIIYNEIENYLQRYGAFLVSDETEDLGSELHRDFEFLRYIFLQFRRHINYIQDKRSGITIKFEQIKDEKKYICHVGNNGKFIIHDNEFPFSVSEEPISKQIIEHYAQGMRKLTRGSRGGRLIEKKHRKELKDREIVHTSPGDGTMKCDQISALNLVMDEYSISTDEWIDADFERRYMKSCINYYESFLRKLVEPEIGGAVIIVQALLNLGRIYEIGIGHGILPANQDKAKEYYEAAKQITENNRDNSDIHFQVGYMYMRRGLISKAKESFEQGIRLTTDEKSPADAQFLLGKIYEKTGEQENDWFRKSSKQYIYTSIKDSIRYRTVEEQFHKLVREDGFSFARAQIAYSEIAKIVDNIDPAISYFRLAEMCKKNVDLVGLYHEIIEDCDRKIVDSPALHEYQINIFRKIIMLENDLAKLIENDNTRDLVKEFYLKAAEKGHPIAQYNLACIYEESKKVEDAAEWYYKSAKQGYPDAQYKLGEIIDCGRGRKLELENREKLSDYWLHKAAYQNCKEAHYKLAEKALEPAHAQRYLLYAASLGHTAAQFKLALMLMNTVHIGEEADAAEWFRKAAEQGHAAAQFELARMYMNDIGVEPDDGNKAKAANWFMEAALQNFPGAEERLRELSDQGHADAQKKLWHLFRNKIEQGHAAAQFELACMYMNDIGVEPDDGNKAKAAEWFQKAAEQGHAAAQFELACMYMNDIGVEPDDGNKAKAAEWFQKAAEQGHAAAQFELACMYMNDIGVEPDDGNKAKAANWFMEAALQDFPGAEERLREFADQGHADVQFGLGYFYERLFSQSMDEAKLDESRKWLNRAANQGHIIAQILLGMTYLAQESKSQNESEAFKWILRAAEQGYPDAQYMIGRLYGSGQGIEKDMRKSLEYHRLAKKSKNFLASFEIGLSLFRDLVEEMTFLVITLYDPRVHCDPSDYQEHYQKISENIDDIAKDDLAEAIESMKFAAENGHARAQCFLGIYFIFRRRYAEAAYYFYSSARLGNELALQILYGYAKAEDDPHFQYLLANIRLDGIDVRGRNKLGIRSGSDEEKFSYPPEAGRWDPEETKPNVDEAATWFLEAAEKNHPGAQFELGCLYYDGRARPSNGNDARMEGVKWLLQSACRNHAEAISWFHEIAERNDDPHVQFLLAAMYRQGWGVEPDPAEVVKWLFKAAEHGHPDAMKQVGVGAPDGYPGKPA